MIKINKNKILSRWHNYNNYDDKYVTYDKNIFIIKIEDIGDIRISAELSNIRFNCDLSKCNYSVFRDICSVLNIIFLKEGRKFDYIRDGNRYYIIDPVYGINYEFLQNNNQCITYSTIKGFYFGYILLELEKLNLQKRYNLTNKLFFGDRCNRNLLFKKEIGTITKKEENIICRQQKNNTLLKIVLEKNKPIKIKNSIYFAELKPDMCNLYRYKIGKGLYHRSSYRGELKTNLVFIKCNINYFDTNKLDKVTNLNKDGQLLKEVIEDTTIRGLLE
jgi:hypothetical protein